MHAITPYLWYDANLNEVIEYYKGIFEEVKVSDQVPIPEGAPGPEDQAIAKLSINGFEFYAMNAGPAFKFTEAFSLMVEVDNQEEVDRYWDALTADGGEESQCGWLKDKYGLSWQITPKILNELMSSPDKVTAEKAMQAMLKMRKIIIADLEAAVR